MVQLEYILADQAKIGQFLLDWDCTHVWEVIKPPQGGHVLRCYGTMPEKVSRYQKGDFAIDYFQARFILLRDRRQADGVLRLAHESGNI